MTEIIKNLWLCSWEHAKVVVPTLNEPLVINCTKNLEYLVENTIRIPIDDTPDDAPILNKFIFPLVNQMYHHLFAGKPVVVHCLAGRQRSAAVVASYLMLHPVNNITGINSVIDYIKTKKLEQIGDRSAFFPYINFEETLFTVSNNSTSNSLSSVTSL